MDDALHARSTANAFLHTLRREGGAALTSGYEVGYVLVPLGV